MNTLEIQTFPELDYGGTEALNTLCSNISFLGANMKRILITSSHASEGKSFVVMNIMRTMARYGKRVALVDMDLRRSMIQTDFGIHTVSGQGMGVAHYLSGMCSIGDIVYQTNIQRAYMVPVGHEVKQSAALLNSSHLPLLLEKLAQEMDVVLVDAPPVGVIIDAAEIARSCDCAMLVVRHDQVHRAELQKAKMQVEAAGCPVLGVIMNDVVMDSYKSKKYYSGNYYAKEYGHEKKKPFGVKKTKKA